MLAFMMHKQVTIKPSGLKPDSKDPKIGVKWDQPNDAHTLAAVRTAAGRFIVLSGGVRKHDKMRGLITCNG
jgi:hypothetical protein